MTAIFSIYFSGGVNLLSKFPNFFKTFFGAKTSELIFEQILEIEFWR